MALKLSSPKRNGQDISPEELEKSRPKPFPIPFEFDEVEWEVWVDFRRVSPALANEYIVAYSKGLRAGEQNESMKKEILSLAGQLKKFGHVEGATETPKAAKGRKGAKVEVAEPTLTMEQIEAVADITDQIKHQSGRYTLAQIVATGDVQNELYESECQVVAAAIVRLDENGDPAAFGGPAINYPDFDPTFEVLSQTGLLGPALVRSVMAHFHPTSAASRPTTQKTEKESSTDSESSLKQAAKPDASPQNTVSL